MGRKDGKIVGGKEIGKGEIIISRSNGFLQEKGLPEHSLLLETHFFPRILWVIFREISIYDFDPKLPKRATPITGKAELEEDGSNLSIILKNIIERKENRRKLFNLVKELLPFVENLNVEKFADKSLPFKLKELFQESLPTCISYF